MYKHYTIKCISTIKIPKNTLLPNLLQKSCALFWDPFVVYETIVKNRRCLIQSCTILMWVCSSVFLGGGVEWDSVGTKVPHCVPCAEMGMMPAVRAAQNCIFLSFTKDWVYPMSGQSDWMYWSLTHFFLSWFLKTASCSPYSYMTLVFLQLEIMWSGASLKKCFTKI